MNAVVMLLPLLLVACDSATKRLDHGRALVTERKYDEAIKVYESIKADYPETPEAKQVSDAIDDAKVAVADHLFADGKFLEAGVAVDAFAEEIKPPFKQGDDIVKFGDALNEWIARIDAATGRSTHPHGLGWARKWAQVSGGPVPHGLMDFDTVYGIWKAAAEHGSAEESTAGFQESLGAWFCENRNDFSTVAGCRPYTSNPRDLPLLKVAATRQAIEAALGACEALHGVVDGKPVPEVGRIGQVCGAEVGTEFDRVMSGLGTTLLIMNDQMPLWRRDLRKDWKISLAGIRDLADNCEGMKRETANLVQQGLRTDRSSAEFFWGGVASGVIKTDAEMPRMIRGYQTKFAANVLVFGNTLKSEYWSDACNKAVDAGLDRVYKDCVESGTPSDTSWLADFMPFECPTSWTPNGE